jgi:hypothetical protein
MRHCCGENPLAFMAVGKAQDNLLAPAKHYLFERQAVFKFGQHRWEWHRYSDHTHPVDRPKWLADPAPGYVTPLTQNVSEYDYDSQVGHKNIGAWIDAAAIKAGR